MCCIIFCDIFLWFWSMKIMDSLFIGDWEILKGSLLWFWNVYERVYGVC